MFDAYFPKDGSQLRVVFTDGTFGLRMATFW